MDSVELDIAVLGKDTCSSLELIDKTHTVELDEILIEFNLFKQIFYPYGDNFCLDKNMSQDNIVYPYITFSAVYRNYKGKPFSLLDTIIENIETDLDVTRNCFTTCSLIDLSKEISNIATLRNIDCYYSSLTLSNIISIIRNSYTTMINDNILKYVILVISVIFKSPNPNILPVIIKFKYKISVTNNIFL
jgi:hypothetical protein